SVGAVTSYNFPNVTANHTIAASFAIDIHTITASAGANGAIAPSGAVPVSHGASQAFTITPDTCYHVADVLVDGGSVGAVTSYNFPNVTANHTIAASFARDTFTIAASAGANGSITPGGAVPVLCGASQAFTIAPDPGYHVADVLVDGGSVGAVTGYNFPNVTANHTIAASFAIDTHTLTVTVVGGGSVTKNPSQASYDHGASVQLTAAPDSGWAFTGWSGDTSGVANPVTLVMTADKAVTATFADTAGPALLVVAPNGGELLGIGSTATLSWTATDNVAVTAVDLFLSRAGAAGPYDSLATGLGNSGSYGWTVTGPATTDAFLKVIARDAAGNARFDLSDAAFTITSGVGVESGAVTDFELAPVWPNPLRGSARIGFAVPRACGLRLSVLDIQGREVAVLADGAYAPGRHQAEWDAAARGGARPGLYFVRLRVPGRVLVRRVVMTR
ncbi:MAG: hypothetical protein HZC42_15065, partial [Candidatus Eisenbacteria bacterium]|nr:hypothetical protein [Candidatus Eisenbacteria bacterium]